MLFIDSVAYDETPLDLVTNDLASHAPTQPPIAAGAPAGPDAGDGAHEQLAQVPFRHAEDVDKFKLRTKILQTEERYAMLFDIRRTLATSRVSYLLIVGENLCFLQQAQDTSGECIANALRALSSVGPDADAFEHRLRFASTDDAGGNDLAERVVLGGRPAGWKRVRLPCEVHKTATVHVATSKPLDDTISQMINLSLALEPKGSARTFATALGNVINCRIKLCTGVCPADAVTHRMLVMRVFLAAGKKRNYKAAILTSVMNGDWRNTTDIEIYQRGGAAESIVSVRKKVKTALLSVSFGSKIARWPRHRWTGADIAVSQLALLAGVHGLLAPAWHEFVRIVNSKAEKAKAAQAERGMEAGGAPAVGDEGAQPAEEPQQNASAQDNARFRVRGTQFVDNKPFSKLVLVRLVLEPLRTLLDSKLFQPSKRWERIQVARAAQSLSQDGGAALSFERRDYRVLLAAANKLENRFYVQLQMLMGPSLWRLLPDEDSTEHMACQSFKMTSLPGCLVEQLLRERHRSSPFLVFKLLLGDDEAEAAAAQLANEREECMLCDWARDFAAKFRGRLRDTEAQLYLWAVLIMGYVGIVRIEAKHASIRRLLLSRVQCPGLNLEDCSSLWCCNRHRCSVAEDPEPVAAIQDAARVEDGVVAQVAAGDAEQPAARPAKKPPSGGGGLGGCIAKGQQKVVKDNTPIGSRSLPIIGLCQWKSATSWRRRRKSLHAAPTTLRIQMARARAFLG